METTVIKFHSINLYISQKIKMSKSKQGNVELSDIFKDMQFFLN